MELQVTVERGLLYTSLISLNGNILHSYIIAQYYTGKLILVQFIIFIQIVWFCMYSLCVYVCVHLVICNFSTCIDLCNYQHCSIITKIMLPFGSYTHNLAVSFLTSVLFCVLLFGDVCHICPHFPLPFFFDRAGNSPLV